jgi:hypothetical protein
VQDVTAENEKNAKQAFETERDNLEKLQVSRDTDETLLKDLKGDSAGLEASVRKYLNSQKPRKQQARQSGTGTGKA